MAAVTLLLLPTVGAAQGSAGMEMSTREAVSAFSAAQSSGDIDALIALFSDDGQWRVDGDTAVPWVGDHRGQPAIRNFLKTFNEHIEVIDAENLSQSFDGENAFQVNRMTLRLKTNGAVIQSNTVVHFEVEDGEITKHNIYEDTYAVTEAWHQGHMTEVGK